MAGANSNLPFLMVSDPPFLYAAQDPGSYFIASGHCLYFYILIKSWLRLKSRFSVALRLDIESSNLYISFFPLQSTRVIVVIVSDAKQPPNCYFGFSISICRV